MKDLLEKMSSYNVFNYLFPGVLVAVLGTAISSIKLLVDDIVVGVFVYYFYGLVVSRIGSLVLEPFLKRLKFVQFASYADFVTASRIDSRIETLSEQNNVYRTLTSAFLCIAILALIDRALVRVPDLAGYALPVAVLLMLALFAWSYRKQTRYVSARVVAILQGQPSDTASGSKDAK